MIEDIEMKTFSITNIVPQQGGDFKGTIDLPSGSYAEFCYYANVGVFDVKTISSEAKGDGSKMMRMVLNEAAHCKAKRMETATSRPGFFKRFGFDYTDAQKITNAKKFTVEQLEKEEANRGDGGGGFAMVRKPPFI